MKTATWKWLDSLRLRKAQQMFQPLNLSHSHLMHTLAAIRQKTRNWQDTSMSRTQPALFARRYASHLMLMIQSDSSMGLIQRRSVSCMELCSSSLCSIKFGSANTRSQKRLLSCRKWRMSTYTKVSKIVITLPVTMHRVLARALQLIPTESRPKLTATITAS